ncbi:TPA: hypothetical protein ACGJPB_003233 [Escherichia coli]|nr:hypothetical protein AC26_1879 [Escherichia coli 1-176-05_S3_C2]WGM52734.1 hypothetical protein OSH18_00715 [Escherichia ruysiae]
MADMINYMASDVLITGAAWSCQGAADLMCPMMLYLWRKYKI